MLKKRAYLWIEKSKAAFEDLKQALMSPPVLEMLNFEENFILECDASGERLGAVLM